MGRGARRTPDEKGLLSGRRDQKRGRIRSRLSITTIKDLPRDTMSTDIILDILDETRIGKQRPSVWPAIYIFWFSGLSFLVFLLSYFLHTRTPSPVQPKSHQVARHLAGLPTEIHGIHQGMRGKSRDGCGPWSTNTASARSLPDTFKRR